MIRRSSTPPTTCTALIQQDAAAPKTNVIATQLAAGRYNAAYNGQNHAFDFAQWRAQEVLRAP